MLPTTLEKKNDITRQISTDREKHFQELGFLDDKGLVIFDTLHQMQYRACQVYAENDLFGTYNPNEEKFEFESFAEFGKQVDRCRAVLKDLGELIFKDF